MDFSSVLGSSENITSIISISSEKVGGYATDLTIGSTGLVSATPTVTVEMSVAGGTFGSSYRIEVLVNTDASQILEGDGILLELRLRDYMLEKQQSCQFGLDVL